MKLFTGIYGFCCVGKVKELRHLFENYPPGTTLQEFLKFNLH